MCFFMHCSKNPCYSDHVHKKQNTLDKISLYIKKIDNKSFYITLSFDNIGEMFFINISVRQITFFPMHKYF